MASVIKMPSVNKKFCKKCEERHVPPTGRNCKRAVEDQVSNSNGLVRDAAVTQAGEGLPDGQQLQWKILEQLEKVNKRLDKVEDKMAVGGDTQDSLELSTSKFSTPSSTSTVKKHKSKRKVQISSDSSSDSDSPNSEVLKSPQLQKKVDKRIRQLETSSQCSGRDTCKHKSKHGGNVEVSVKTKVSWPHEPILGGVNRQRINYDQLSLTQWVHGFCQNILDEPSVKRRDVMVAYMGELMEDATDFSWQGAKAANAVLLCEMERGKITWEDQGRIDRIHRAYAQKHVGSNKSNWPKLGEHTRKPWFCKSFQTGMCASLKDHETNGKLHRHICAFCLSMGKQLQHAEKDCIHKKNGSKNEPGAASH